MPAGSGAIGAACEVPETAKSDKPATTTANTIRVIASSLNYSAKSVAPATLSSCNEPSMNRTHEKRRAHGVTPLLCEHQPAA
jgi:hypothetical protein